MRIIIRKSLTLTIAAIVVGMVYLSAFGFQQIVSNKSTDVNAQTISACMNRVNVPSSELHWIYVPDNASALHTEENYYFLAGQLIASKAVDASTCPADGLTLNGYANACGMSVAKPSVIFLQNALDDAILQAWKDVGVPPVLLKQMIRTESQFYPSMYGQSHFGYGHITNMGMRNALEWNRNLYTKVCPASAGGTCASSISIADQILSTLVLTCPTCQYGVDLTRAAYSVDIMAEVVLGYCFQAAQLAFNATGWYSANLLDYATMWKLTLMNYNAGSECVFSSVRDAFKARQGPLSWNDISGNVKSELCVRGMTYANQITAKYYNFPPK